PGGVGPSRGRAGPAGRGGAAAGRLGVGPGRVVGRFPRDGRARGRRGARGAGCERDPSGAGMKRDGPLSGRTVVVTRPAGEADPLAGMLRSEGADVLEAPAIEIVGLADTSALDLAVRELAAGRFAWVSFSSPRSVDIIAERLDSLGLSRTFRVSVAAVGPATAAR